MRFQTFLPNCQDVLQETFVKIWRNAANYNPDKGRFYTWAYRIARNQSLNSIRTRKKLIQTEEIGVYTDITVETEAPIALNKLSGAVSNLEPHHQKAINAKGYSSAYVVTITK